MPSPSSTLETVAADEGQGRSSRAAIGPPVATFPAAACAVSRTGYRQPRPPPRRLSTVRKLIRPRRRPVARKSMLHAQGHSGVLRTTPAECSQSRYAVTPAVSVLHYQNVHVTPAVSTLHQQSVRVTPAVSALHQHSVRVTPAAVPELHQQNPALRQQNIRITLAE